MNDLCMKCEHIGNGSDGICIICSNNYTNNFKPMRNVERIKNMKDKELAEFLASEQCCMMSESWDVYSILAWLRKESEA